MKPRKNKKIPIKFYLCAAYKDDKVVDLWYAHSLEDYEATSKKYEEAGCTTEYDYLLDLELKRKNKPKTLTDKEQKSQRESKKWAKRIRCVETGKVYACLSDLIKSIGVKRYLLEARIRDNIVINGNHYEYVDEQ